MMKIQPISLNKCNNEMQYTVSPFGQNKVSVLQHRDLLQHADLRKLLAVLLTCKEAQIALESGCLEAPLTE